jgi:protein-L-isoaspartate(D-aspartate) O-methyltransferase
MADFAKARRMMVDCQLRTFEVFNTEVLAAFDNVERELFLPENLRSLAYSDKSITFPARETGKARFLLAPMILARMIQSLDLAEGEEVLDIGCGTGYSCAILNELGVKVTGLETDDALAQIAHDILSKASCDNVQIRTGSLSDGFAKGGPYDAVLINGSIQQRPNTLLDQLKPGGRLICIEGDDYSGRAVLYVKAGQASGSKIVFQATAPLLQDFARVQEFQF